MYKYLISVRGENNSESSRIVIADDIEEAEQKAVGFGECVVFVYREEIKEKM